MRKFKSLLMMLLALMLTTSVYAQTFKVDGVTYQISQNAPVNGRGEAFIQDVDNVTASIDLSAKTEVTDAHKFVYDIRGIAGSAFTASKYNIVTEVKLPSSIYYIKGDAFNGTQITSIELPTNLVTISAGSFHNEVFQEFKIDASAPNYEVHDGVLYMKSQGKKVFCHYPQGKKTLEYSIPEGVTDISQMSITNVRGLKKINIPASVNNISIRPFDGGSLEYIEVAKENSNYCDIQGVLFNKPATEMVSFAPNYLFPLYDQATPKPTYTMQSNDGSYKVPDGVKQINDWALIRAIHLNTLDLNQVETLKNTSIANDAGLTSIHIGPALKNIEPGAIWNNNAIKEFTVDPENKKYKLTKNYGALYYYDEEGLEQIDANGNKAIYTDRKNQNVVIAFPAAKEGNDAITADKCDPAIDRIGYHAIAYNSVLTSVTLADNIKVLDSHAFYGCANLKTVNLGTSTDNTNPLIVGGEAFRTCPSLTSVNFPTRTQVVCGAAFHGCAKLTSVTFHAGLLQSINSYAFQDCDLRNVYFSTGEHATFTGDFDQLTAFGDYAFANNKNLSGFNFPKSLTSIGKYCFTGDESLAGVYFPYDGALKTIGDYAFAYSGLRTISSLPKGLEKIGDRSFLDCKQLTYITIPEKVNKIHELSFLGCEKLVAYNVDTKNDTYASSDGMLVSRNKKVLVSYPEGKQDDIVMLPSSLTEIGNAAFKENTHLKYVIIPRNVVKIGYRAFQGCTNLELMTLLCPYEEYTDGEETKAVPALTSKRHYSNKPDEPFIAYKEDNPDLTNTFDESAYSKMKLRVRKGIKDLLVNDPVWSKIPTENVEESFIIQVNDGAELEYMPLNKNTHIADIVSINKANDVENLVVPKEVENNGEKYNVIYIGDYFYEDNINVKGTPQAKANAEHPVKEVIIEGNEVYVGARTFADANKESTIKDVVFLGTAPITYDTEIGESGATVMKNVKADTRSLAVTRFGLNPSDFLKSDGVTYANNEFYGAFNENQPIYVRYSQSKENASTGYLASWEQYADQITYKIPYTQENRFGTFAREFPVWFNMWDEDKNDQNIDIINENGKHQRKYLCAFVAQTGFVEGETNYIQMRSIFNDLTQNNTDGSISSLDGLTIPANTGVLIEKYADLEGGNFYQIHEGVGSGLTGMMDHQDDLPHIVKGITQKRQLAKASDATATRYILQGGKAVKLPDNLSNYYLSVNTSYLELTADQSAGAKKVVFLFDNNDATAINGVTNKETSNATIDPYYNLAGQRVANPKGGIFIQNGKKVVIK